MPQWEECDCVASSMAALCRDGEDGKIRSPSRYCCEQADKGKTIKNR